MYKFNSLLLQHLFHSGEGLAYLSLGQIPDLDGVAELSNHHPSYQAKVQEMTLMDVSNTKYEKILRIGSGAGVSKLKPTIPILMNNFVF